MEPYCQFSKRSEHEMQVFLKPDDCTDHLELTVGDDAIDGRVRQR